MNDTSALQQEDLRKLQMVLLDMLSEVDRICRKYEINYTLIGGTLLGAVRHQGFIPWDDDVDVSLLRDEYERFKSVCGDELNSEKFFFQDHTTDPNYRWGYARLRRKDSEFVRIGQEHMDMKTGIFLDIFIGDNVPDFYPLRLLHAAYCFILRKILYAQTGSITGGNYFTRFVYRLLNLIPAVFVFRRLEGVSRFWGRRQTKLVRTLTFPLPKGWKLGAPMCWYTETIDMEFEGKKFKVIRYFDEYLRFKYGDYMTLPPENKRHWHPAAVIRLPDEH